MNATRLLSSCKPACWRPSLLRNVMIHVIATQWPAFGNAWWTTFVEAALMAEMALLVLWAGLGPGAWWMRTVSLAIGLALLCGAENLEHTFYDEHYEYDNQYETGGLIDESRWRMVK